ncbi:hypothetical protein NQ318_009138 [Aromia moschata]|uniref:Uncharacterized protein n=1 Tax=Aromia moschata TaxID=1265417 RepID=A0AAV8X9S6_9CUCU|nr:hypothetical protein NQ318_009138 [Aromia moschata]
MASKIIPLNADGLFSLGDKVYQTPLTDLEDLKNRIRNECEALNVQLLRSVTTPELLHRAECCVNQMDNTLNLFFSIISSAHGAGCSRT